MTKNEIRTKLHRAIAEDRSFTLYPERYNEGEPILQVNPTNFTTIVLLDALQKVASCTDEEGVGDTQEEGCCNMVELVRTSGESIYLEYGDIHFIELLDTEEEESEALRQYYEFFKEVTEHPTEEEERMAKAVLVLDEVGDHYPVFTMLSIGMTETTRRHELFAFRGRYNLAGKMNEENIYPLPQERVQHFLALRRLLLNREVPSHELRIPDIIYSAYKYTEDIVEPDPFESWASTISLTPEWEALSRLKKERDAKEFWEG